MFRAVAMVFVGLVCSAWVVGCADVLPIEDGKTYGEVVAIQDWFTSCHLVKTKDAVVLIDACFRADVLKSGLEKQGLKPEDVTHVLLTHGHQDHVAGLSLLKNAKVMAFTEDQDLLTKHAGEDGKIDQPLKDGEVLTLGGVNIKVFSVKGHTEGSAVFLINQTLVLGDSALINSKSELVPTGSDRAENPELLVKSLLDLDKRLIKENHDVLWLLPSHSGGLKGRAALTAFAKEQNP